MAVVLSLAIGLIMAGGVWLALRPRSFSVVLGLTLMSYAVNLLILVSGRVDRVMPPLALPGATGLADPLPQALVLTAIVIGFGMTAFLIALALKALAVNRSDKLGEGRPTEPTPTQADD
ncbi:Na+/H+ antiporter subunit C [Polymorphobacter sp.]|uniref:Na+/H+ antiporter subunit C n=1 Tax=Polymorphobacter sp. TaxID=1909290 RepID=UPI003F6E965F